ncbi:MAG: hypothetical protein CXZ00_09825 [Acidobacteria bacterium]|nr:MAG: hypothetical protein CXZ00_09825 [Acidobacteriota bacterium]
MNTNRIAVTAALFLCLPAFAQNAQWPQGEQPSGPPPQVSEQPPQYPRGAAEPQAPAPVPQQFPQPRDYRRPPAVVIVPRAEAAAYPVYCQGRGFSVGARLLSAKEVGRKFATPLGKKYLVVEVGVFPAAAQTVLLRPSDFTLRADGDNQAFFPAAPDDIASALSPGSGPHRTGAHPGVGVGYGPWGPTVGVGVGVGPGPNSYPRGAAEEDREVMEDELRDKSLPSGSVTRPVAGYLYFPLKGKAKHYSLELTLNGQAMSLPLPVPTN